MKKFKIIIKESADFAGRGFSFNFNNLAMYQSANRNGTQLIFYYADKTKDPKDINAVEVVGRVTFGETDKPCVPRTNEVNTIYVEEKHRGTGLGDFLYAMAFYHNNRRGVGLTSDHSVGTKDKAAKKWKIFSKSDEFRKRQTADGNTKFDYNDRTPDPNDDCDKPSEGRPAANYSLFYKNYSSFKKAYDTLKQRSHDNEDYFKFRMGLDNHLEEKAAEGFARAYK